MKNLLFVFFILSTYFAESQITFDKLFFEIDDINWIDELKSADLDGDGDADFVIQWNLGGELYALINNGANPPDVNLIFEGDSRFIEVVDFDDDGDMDIFGTDPFDSKVYYFKNDGNASFSEISYPFDYESIHFADLNSDGEIEMIIGLNDAVRILTHNNSGGPKYKQIAYEDFSLGAINGISTFDENGDGLLDIVACCSSEGIVIIDQFSEDNFSARDAIPNSYSMERAAVSDLNSDGHMDVLAFGSFGGETNVFMNQGDNTYEKMTLPKEIGRNAYSSFGDIDGDGDMDVLFIEEQSTSTGKISIYHNEKGDFNKILVSDEYSDTETGEFVDVDGDGKKEIVIFTNYFFNPGLLIFSTNLVNTKDALSKNPSIQIYPNPCIEDFTIETATPVSIRIFNQSGKFVTKAFIKNKKRINCSLWDNGLYTIEMILGEEHVVPQKVLKINR